MASSRPEPTQLKALKGNPGKRQLKLPAVQATGEPFAPDHLRSDAQACIDVIRSSMPPGLYRRVDTFALAAFATAWALHKEAVEALAARDEQGNPLNPVVESGSTGNRVPSPWVKVLSQQAQLMASLGDRLGLDPKSRAALHLPDEKPASKFDGLVGNARALRLVK